MALLLVAMVMASVVTKWVQDGRTDRAYASRGMVSPRYQERLARLEKAGRPNMRRTAASRGPLRSYLGELYADAILDLSERHRAKRAHRGPYVYDPNKPTLAQRFRDGLAGEVERYKRKAGWSQPEPELAPAVAVPESVPLNRDALEPGTWTVGDDGRRVELKPAGYAPPSVGDRNTDGRPLEWTGKVWAPVCSCSNKPMGDHDERGSLRCGTCNLRAVDDKPEPTNQETSGGEIMSAPTGEAVNYETTVNQIQAAEELVSTVAERLDGADLAVAELRGTVEQLSAAMGALHLDDGSMSGVNAALESLDPEHFADLFTKLDTAKVGLASARDSVVSTYGDAAATVAATGVDAEFLQPA